MSKVLIFGGTTEGRLLSERLLKHKIDFTLSVATEGGYDMVMDLGVKCLVNRLDKNDMTRLLKDFDLVVDATHPYAKEATENILYACEKTNKKYIRLLRESINSKGCICKDSIEEVVDYLNTVDGNILLTTGSKNLNEFKGIKDFEKRIYPRVLPTVDAIEKCTILGFKINNIIAVMGPFSEDMNISIINKVNAKYVVSKESGTVGGFLEKISACEKTGAKLIVIGRENNELGYSLDEVENIILKDFNIDVKFSKYFPMFVDLTDKKIKVFGGGEIATRRIKTLLNFTSNIEVISPSVTEKLNNIINSGKIKYIKDEYKEEYVTGDLVLSLTNSREVNNKVYLKCREKGILCNIGDKKEECDFYFPGVAFKDNVVVGVTSSGENHSEAKKVTQNIKALLGGAVWGEK